VSVNEPGWILRHYNFDLWLESQVSPRNPGIIQNDASFYLRDSLYYPGFFMLESYNYPTYFIEKDTSTRGFYIRQDVALGASEKQSSYLFVERAL
jgi:hypothetical protein